MCQLENPSGNLIGLKLQVLCNSGVYAPFN